MKKHLLSVLMIALASFVCSSQSNTNNKTPEGQTSFFAEAGGPGIMFSANIDRRFSKNQYGAGGRLGVGFVTVWEDYNPSSGVYTGGRQRSVASIPFQLNYVFGKNNSPHCFEAGVGFTVLSKKVEVLNYYDEDASQFFGTFAFMYRRQPVGGGFSWRAGFTPLIAKGYIQPMGGVSVGFNF